MAPVLHAEEEAAYERPHLDVERPPRLDDEQPVDVGGRMVAAGTPDTERTSARAEARTTWTCSAPAVRNTVRSASWRATTASRAQPNASASNPPRTANAA